MLVIFKGYGGVFALDPIIPNSAPLVCTALPLGVARPFEGEGGVEGGESVVLVTALAPLKFCSGRNRMTSSSNSSSIKNRYYLLKKIMVIIPWFMRSSSSSSSSTNSNLPAVNATSSLSSSSRESSSTERLSSAGGATGVGTGTEV